MEHRHKWQCLGDTTLICNGCNTVSDIADLPYGVIDLNAIQGSESIKQRAGFLHKDEPTRHQLHVMAHSLSYGYWDNRHSMKGD